MAGKKINLGNDVLDSVINEMSKDNIYGGLLNESTYALPSEHIDTGNYLLNAAYSGSLRKGFPNNRSICLAGDEGTGKTFIALNACANAQKKGYFIIWYDSEGSVESDMADNFGIDSSRFMHEPIATLEKFRIKISNLLEQLVDAKKKKQDMPKIMIVLDSLSMLASSKEIADALSGSDKADFTRAKTIRSIFRIITCDMTGLKIPMIFTNHLSANIGGYGAPFEIPGGKGLKYAASIISVYTKAKITEADKVQSGIILTSKMYKNRFAAPHTIKIHIKFQEGMNPYIGLHDFISWDDCGIERGSIISVKDFEKRTPAEQKKCRSFKNEDDKDVYMYPNPKAQGFICKHLGKSVKAAQLFTPEVFSEEVLDELDENVIKPMFEFGRVDDDISEITTILNDKSESTDPVSTQ